MDKNKIYQTLNHLDSPYEEISLNEFEKNKLKGLSKTFAKKKKKERLRKYKQIAAVLVLSLAIGSFTFNENVRAKTLAIADSIQLSLSQSFGFPLGSQAYDIALQEPFAIGQDEYQLENLTIDGKDLWISILQPAKGNFPQEDSPFLSSIKINDERIKVISWGGSFGPLEGQEGVLVSTIHCQLEKPLEIQEESPLDLYFSDFNKKKATLSLSVSPEQIYKETRVLLEDFPIPGTDGIKIKSFTLNPVSQKILLSYPDTRGSLATDLEGFDDQGRKVVFQVTYSDKNEAALFFSPLTSEITADQLMEEVDSLTLSLYGTKLSMESGRSNPSEKWSQEFTISLK